MAARRSADNDFVAFVLDELTDMGEVTARSMFGGHGLYCGEVFFAIVSRSRLYLKVDKESRADYEAAGMEPFRPSARQTIRTYYEVPADVMENRYALVAWAQRAVEAARRAKEG